MEEEKKVVEAVAEEAAAPAQEAAPAEQNKDYLQNPIAS